VGCAGRTGPVAVPASAGRSVGLGSMGIDGCGADAGPDPRWGWVRNGSAEEGRQRSVCEHMAIGEQACVTLLRAQSVAMSRCALRWVGGISWHGTRHGSKSRTMHGIIDDRRQGTRRGVEKSRTSTVDSGLSAVDSGFRFGCHRLHRSCNLIQAKFNSTSRSIPFSSSRQIVLCGIMSDIRARPSAKSQRSIANGKVDAARTAPAPTLDRDEVGEKHHHVHVILELRLVCGTSAGVTLLMHTQLERKMQRLQWLKMLRGMIMGWGLLAVVWFGSKVSGLSGGAMAVTRSAHQSPRKGCCGG
jgi:hypothetical protein